MPKTPPNPLDLDRPFLLSLAAMVLVALALWFGVCLPYLRAVEGLL